MYTSQETPSVSSVWQGRGCPEMWRGEFSKESEGERKTERQLEAELEKKILLKKKSVGGIWGKGEREREIIVSH